MTDADAETETAAIKKDVARIMRDVDTLIAGDVELTAEEKAEIRAAIRGEKCKP